MEGESNDEQRSVELESEEGKEETKGGEEEDHDEEESREKEGE